MNIEKQQEIFFCLFFLSIKEILVCKIIIPYLKYAGNEQDH